VTNQSEEESCSKKMPPNEDRASAANNANNGSDESRKMVEGDRGAKGAIDAGTTTATDTKVQMEAVEGGAGSAKKAKQGLYT
jgi:hypothetical protein